MHSPPRRETHESLGTINHVMTIGTVVGIANTGPLGAAGRILATS